MGMTYKKLYEDALFRLEHNKITLGEFEEMIKPLEREIEQEPTTKNDLGVDCISRQAVIDNAGLSEWFDSSDSYNEFVFALNELPSVTPQPRKGHWKLVQRGKFIDVCCSNCEAVRIKDYAYNYTIDELNKEDINECFGSAEMRFCPNCGSRNEVEE